MPPRPSTDRPHHSLRPTERDLDQLSHALRTTAQERNVSEQVVARYEEWIFLFLGWCLKVPPFHLHRDRLGEFWKALTQRQVGKGKVCEAMDALGFFFGGVVGETSLPCINPPPSEEEKEENTESPRNLASALPDGSLPDGVDARATIPTRSEAPLYPSTSGAAPDNDDPAENASSDDASSEDPSRADETTEEVHSPEPSEDPPSFWNLLQSDGDEAAACNGSEASEETASVQIPASVADRVEAIAHQHGLSAEEFATQVLKSACDDAERPRSQEVVEQL